MNVFFLFGGTRPRRKCFAQGTFHCPACGRPAAYERCTSASWVHLYWIPLFRVGAEQEVVVCSSCGVVLNPQVIEGGARGPSEPGEKRTGTTWTCSRCRNVNPEGAVSCLRCGDVP